MSTTKNSIAALNISKFIRKATNSIEVISKQVLLEVGNRLVYYSAIGNPLEWKTAPYWPKGYEPGHFINNWQLGINTVPNSIIPTIDASGRGSIVRMSQVGKYIAGKTFYFANNLPYAALLETGTHSLQVGPQGMVGRVKLEFKQIVKDAEAKVTSQQGGA